MVSNCPLCPCVGSEMEAEAYKSDVHSADAARFWPVMPKHGDLNQRSREAEGWKLVNVCLLGGAPWGFTLRGGLEHQEPLVITKVEEGSKAAAVSLQVGDELVNINQIPLSGYRQEAICLVKGSHKTLTLVVRRRNEPVSRPHSWHSTKFNENQSESSKTQSPPTAVWHCRYDASSSDNDLSGGWEQTNLCRASDQFSSLGSMDSLEHVSQSNNSMEHLGGGKRDSAYSSFSTSSSTPDYTLSKSNAASTENMLYKVTQWDAGGRRGQGAAADGVKLEDRLPYFQMPGVGPGHDGLPTEDPAGSRHSTSSRISFGPVWNVPEKKKAASTSPPPPPPPARSNSFAAAKAHERGLVTAPPEGLESHCRALKNLRSHSISLKNDSRNIHTSTDKSTHAAFSPNKPSSLSGSDAHHGHGASQPFQQPHHSDKSAYLPQPWTPPASKTQSVGGYHSSLQDLPTHSSAQHLSQNQRWSLSSNLSSAAADHESGGPSRYYCITTSHGTHPNHPSLSEIPEVRGSAAGLPQERRSTSPQAAPKARHHLPQHSPRSEDNAAHGKHQVTAAPEPSGRKMSWGEGGVQRGPNTQTAEPQYAPEQRRSLPPQLRETSQEVRQPIPASNTISPQTTPMLHSLSVCATARQDHAAGASSEEALETQQIARSNRFATTLRNEIQTRRARMQKSRSAAALPDAELKAEPEPRADPEEWRSAHSSTSAEGSFSNTYKDHLKEVQEKVLKATSFRRRDLEPVLLELSKEANHPSSVHKNVDPVLNQPGTSNSGLSSGQVPRIGARKRFTAEKKVRCFSEPDKIHEVGVDQDPSGNTSSPGNQQELTSAEPFSKQVPVQSHDKIRGRNVAPHGAAEDTLRGGARSETAEGAPHHAPSAYDNQRLGTFAEYEARWSKQRKAPEKKPSGRYHSADNIVDSTPEDSDKACFHERSRSSPSAHIYGQKISVPAGQSDARYYQTEGGAAEALTAESGFSGDGEENPAEFKNDSPPLAPPMTGANLDSRQGAAPAALSHRPTSFSHSATESGPSQSDEHSHTAGRKPSAPETLPPAASPEPASCESLTGSLSEVSFCRSPTAQPSSSLHPSHAVRGDSEQGRGLVDKGQGAAHHPSKPSPPPASSPPASSYRSSGLSGMERRRTPSPQFSPQRLSDKPPVPFPQEDSDRSVPVIQNQSSAARRVPIRIVHSEGTAEKEHSPFLQQSELVHVEAGGPGAGRVGSFGALAEDSDFCAFSRNCNKTPETQVQQRPETDAYMTTIGDDVQLPPPPPMVAYMMTIGDDVQLPLPPPPPPADEPVGTTAGIQEEQKREELARDIMGKDKSLAEILDQSKMRTTMDLMEGLFPEGEQLVEEAHMRRKVHSKQTNPRPAEEREKKDDVAAAVTMVTSSTYYSTSAPKAELLIKMKDMQQHEEEEDSEDELDIDLANKKQELIDSLSKKLQVLREARESLQEDILDNNALGEEVEVRVQQVCKPNELDKFRMFVGDLDKVVSLLLSLSGRLARVENALNSLEEDATAEERVSEELPERPQMTSLRGVSCQTDVLLLLLPQRTLIEKRKLLIRQHEDAKELKENLDRRERVVYEILANYLEDDGLMDYEHFVKMKSALIIEQRKLEDKIKLGEEQLKCLIDSLPIEQRLAL
uniref:Shroom family member 2 n=1 Tax=Oryzias latipes TaxID=8090 RepID=A0A3P9L6V8_ORYLA